MSLSSIPPTRMYTLYFLTVAFIALHTLTTGCPFHHPPPEPSAPSVCHTECPSGWHTWLENRCFIMVGERLQWTQAEERCQELVKEACGQGVIGHLVSFSVSYFHFDHIFFFCTLVRLDGVNDAYWYTWLCNVYQGDVGLNYLFHSNCILLIRLKNRPTLREKHEWMNLCYEAPIVNMFIWCKDV